MRLLSYSVVLALLAIPLVGCGHKGPPHEAKEGPHEKHEKHEGEHHAHQIVVTSPIRKDVTETRPYVCQIKSCRHIEVRALEGGYLEEIAVKEGQLVKEGDRLFKILPVIYEANLASEVAEVQRAQIEVNNAEGLLKKGFVAAPEFALKQAALAKAKAKLALAKAELAFTDVKAPFDGIVDRQRKQLGSLIEEGDVLTTLSDNSTMWVYFNVPEARYLEYKADLDKAKVSSTVSAKKSDDDDDDDDQDDDDDDDSELEIELRLANHTIFNQEGKIGAVEADFNNTTGNIAFRADFPNTERLLRNGQTGTILIHREIEDAIVIPQRATFPILAKRYVYVVDKDNVVHQRQITTEGEQDDIFVVKEGLNESDKIILEGVRQVHDGDQIEYEFRDPEEVLKHLKYHAE